MLLIQLSPNHSIYMMRHTALGVWQTVMKYLFFLAWLGSSFPGCVLLNDMVNSKYVVDVKSGDFGVWIGHQNELPAPAQWIAFQLDHTFNQVSQARCQF